MSNGFYFAHTMLRVKDLKASLKFYVDVLGMSVVKKTDHENGKFSLCFLTFLKEGEVIPQDPAEHKKWLATKGGVLELTHNWGTENDPNFSYNTGNGENGGFGHIAISVPDLATAVKKMDEAGVKFKKRPEEGRMRDIAFVFDPDGYWVELITQFN